MENLKSILEQHPFFKDLKPDYLDFIVGCASNVRFNEDETILKQGEDADQFYLLREGMVAIDVPLTGQDSTTIQTVRKGDILGWSWLVSPYRYRFTARAIQDTRAIALNGKCLREKCEQNHDLGYELLKRLTTVFTQRLEATRLQLVGLYK